MVGAVDVEYVRAIPTLRIPLEAIVVSCPWSDPITLFLDENCWHIIGSIGSDAAEVEAATSRSTLTLVGLEVVSYIGKALTRRIALESERSRSFSVEYAKNHLRGILASLNALSASGGEAAIFAERISSDLMARRTATESAHEYAQDADYIRLYSGVVPSYRLKQYEGVLAGVLEPVGLDVSIAHLSLSPWMNGSEVFVLTSPYPPSTLLGLVEETWVSWTLNESGSIHSKVEVCWEESPYELLGIAFATRTAISMMHWLGDYAYTAGFQETFPNIVADLERTIAYVYSHQQSVDPIVAEGARRSYENGIVAGFERLSAEGKLTIERPQ